MPSPADHRRRRALPAVAAALALLCGGGPALARRPAATLPSASAPGKPQFKGSFSGGDIYLEDVTYTLRLQYPRSVTIDPKHPKVAYVGSWDGYVFKTTDGGKTWDESRLIVERRPFFGDAGQRLYFGVHRLGGSPGHGLDNVFGVNRTVRRHGVTLRRPSVVGSPDITGGAGGRVGAAENVNFGIGLPGGAPRLQNVVRKFGKPTAGLNIKQTLWLRGFIPTEVRIVVIHPNNPKIVFACTMFGLFMSYDGGLNWVRTFQGVNPRGRMILHVAVDPQNDKKVFLATGNGLYISTDGGENYIKSTSQGVGGGVMDWIYFNPYDSRYVFVGTDYGLLRSKDGGENWEWIYFTTFPPARVVRYIEIDPFNRKSGYIATHDGLFWTDNILTASLEDWKRLGGLRFTGMETSKIDLNPTRKGHMWALSNMKLPRVDVGGLHDSGGAFVWESVDGGKNWRVIYSGETEGSIQWYAVDPEEPDLLWFVWSRAMTRMRRRKPGEKEPRISAAQARQLQRLLSAETVPTIGEVLFAAMRYTGTEATRQHNYRWRSRIKALVPRLDLSLSNINLADTLLTHDGLYPLLPFRRTTQTPYRSWDFRVMLNWDLSPLVFNLQSEFFGRTERLNHEARSFLKSAIHRFYGEYRRLRAQFITRPPKDFRVRLMYKLRMEELHAYVDFITGGYLTHYAKGGRPRGWDAKWFERWPGTGPDFDHRRQQLPIQGVKR